MKIFKDKNLTQEIKDEIFDLGIVEADSEKEFIFYIFNAETKAEYYELAFRILKKVIDENEEEHWEVHPELEILEAPEELKPRSIGELRILCKPLVTIKEAIKARLEIKGKELWG